MSGLLHRNATASPLASLNLLTLAVACFAVLDTTAKWVTAEVPVVMTLWLLFVFQTAVYCVMVVASGRLARWRQAKLGWQAARGVLLLAVQSLAILSLQYLPVGEFTAVAMTTPLLVTLLAGRILGEYVSMVRVVLVLGGFAGTLVIVRPGASLLGWTVLLPLGLVLCNTAYQLLTSWMARTQDAMLTLLCTSMVCLVVSSLFVARSWHPGMDVPHGLGLLLMGVAATSGNLLFVKAFERTTAASLMPYMYLQIGFGMLGGWLVFRHVPDQWSTLGVALIVLCGVAGGVLTARESRGVAATDV